MHQELGLSEESVKVVNTDEITRKIERDAVIKKIKDGHFEIVIIVNMLLEGFDYPPFSIAGIVTNITSLVKFTQFVGRIQRLVRHKNAEGKIEIETGITGDVITHKHFKIAHLFNEAFEPRIPETEKEDLDETEDNSDNEDDN